MKTNRMGSTSAVLAVAFLLGLQNAHAASGRTNIFVKAGGACGGKGSSNKPYRCLSDAQSAKGWDDLIVLGSSDVLDGGIQLKDGQNILGECSDQGNRRLQNSTTAFDGDAIVASGNNTISGITISSARRAGINGQASTLLTADCVKITNANTGHATHTFTLGAPYSAPVAYPYGAIDLLGTAKSGVTTLNNISVMNSDFGIALSTSGSAQRAYLVNNATIAEIGANSVPSEVDGILVIATGSSSQSGLINRADISGISGGYWAIGYLASEGIMFETADRGRLPYSDVSRSNIRSGFAAIQTVPQADLGANPPTDIYNFHDNSLANTFYTIIIRATNPGYRVLANIEDNSVINDPNVFIADIFTVLFSEVASNSQVTMNIKNNVVANSFAGLFAVGNYYVSPGTPPSYTANISGNRAKNVGVPFVIAAEFGGASLNAVNYRATNNCLENSGFFANWAGVNLGQIFFGGAGYAPPPASSNISFARNNFINPIQGDLSFLGLSGAFDVLLSYGWSANLSGNYWTNGAARDFVDSGAGGNAQGAGTFLASGPASCNVPDYAP